MPSKIEKRRAASSRGGNAVGKKRKSRRRDDSNSSDASSSNEMSTEATTPMRRSSGARVTTEAQRNTGKKQDKVIIRMLKELKEDTNEMLKELKEDTNEMHKHLKKLAKSHYELRKQLELHINGSTGDDSAASRSELDQMQPPRYRLVFTCDVKDVIEKGQIIETKTNGETISVALHDDQGQIVQTEPLASATVRLVVVKGEFNQRDSQYNWSKKDFEKSIKKPRQGNSATGDENQSVESIVSNCVFKLNGGVKSNINATVLDNSSNKKVRLGAMVISPTEERVLEGLSNPFFVRGHDRPPRQSDRRQNGSTRQIAAPLQLIGNTIVPSTEPSTSACIQQDQFPHPTIYGTSMAQAMYSLYAGGEQLEPLSDYLMEPHSAPDNYSTGTQFNMDQIARPVQLVWDRPNVEPGKRWNLLDQLMPLYSSQPKFNNYGLPTVRPMTGHFGSVDFIPKELMQTRQNKGVLIQPLEPDDSDEERPLKRRLHSKYRLRFVNKVCEAYYKGEQIKADDGNLVKVSLVDETNTTITSGPLSSASVEIVVLHGDFNFDGQDYWTSEEFSRCIVYLGPEKEATVLGGDRILILAGGEACLGDSFFRTTSLSARTGKFMMGVMLASAQDERIQEGISEPFLVRDRRPWKAVPPGFRFDPTDEELIAHYLRNHAATAHIIAKVDIYKSDPWDLPAKAIFGEREWYFFCTLDPNRAAGSGYWKATGKDRTIALSAEVLGIKEEFVFYRGCPPKGDRTSWSMHEYRIAAATTTSSSSTSSMTLDEWVLCKIYSKDLQLQLSSPMDDEEGLDDHHVHDYLSFTDLPPGFRFQPTEQELIVHYLLRCHRATTAVIIPDIDISKLEPWDIPDKAIIPSDCEWYFFSPRYGKYGSDLLSTNRSTEAAGYWKATGKYRPIILRNKILGFRKTLIFYTKGAKTEWVMHEYRATVNIAQRSWGSPQEWLLCKLSRVKNQLQRLPSTKSKFRPVAAPTRLARPSRPDAVPQEHGGERRQRAKVRRGGLALQREEEHEENPGRGGRRGQEQQRQRGY